MTSQRGPLKVAILTRMCRIWWKWQAWQKFVNPLTICQIRQQRGPLKKGEFGEIRQRCDWTSYHMFKGSPSAVAILTKMVNMAMRPKWRIRHFRQICHFRQNHHFSRDPFGPLWIFAKFILFPNLPFSSLVTFQGPLWTSLNFRQTFDELSPDLPFSLLHAFLVIRKVSRVIIIEGD